MSADEMTMTAEPEVTATPEAAPKAAKTPRKSRAKAKAAEAPAVEAAAAPVTAESVLPEQVESMLANIEAEAPAPAVEAAAVEAAAVEAAAAAEAEVKQSEFDVEMRLFNGGANLFGKSENLAVMSAMAAEAGVEVKETKNGNPYITVERDQIPAMIATAEAAGLKIDDARPREQARQAAQYAAKQQAKEELKFEGASNLLIQASQRLFETGKTFVPGQELNVYQTKESVAEQQKLAEMREAGKDVNAKPIELGIYDKRTETVIAKGTVGRDENGKVEVHVSLDQIAKANERRPDNLQLIIPTREKVLENLSKAVEQRAVKPVLKAKAAAQQDR